MIEIDEERGIVTQVEGAKRRSYPLGSREGFRIVSRAWLRSGWDAKHVYSFTWLGRPIIQLPEDMIRVQEAIFALKPDVIVETGVAHGGSAIFYASLLEVMGKGRVIAVDIDIRAHNRRAIESHPLFARITLIEGDSVAEETVSQVRAAIEGAETVMVILDARHTRDHVRRELESYGPMVSAGSYIVACDGIMKDVVGAPRTEPGWREDNPQGAVSDFLAQTSDFDLAPPAFAFDESAGIDPITYWPNAWLRRRPES